LSEKEKIFNTKARVTCKRPAAVAKNWQVRQKSKPKLLQGFISPVHFVVARSPARGRGQCPGVALFGGRNFWWKEGRANGLSRI